MKRPLDGFLEQNAQDGKGFPLSTTHEDGTFLAAQRGVGQVVSHIISKGLHR